MERAVDTKSLHVSLFSRRGRFVRGWTSAMRRMPPRELRRLSALVGGCRGFCHPHGRRDEPTIACRAAPQWHAQAPAAFTAVAVVAERRVHARGRWADAGA